MNSTSESATTAPSWTPGALVDQEPPDPGEPEASTTEPLEGRVTVEPSRVVRPARRRAGPAGWLLGIGAFVLAGGLSFAVGRATVPASTGSGAGANTNGQQFAGGAAGPNGSFRPDGSGGPGDRGFGSGAGGLAISGTVESVGTGTITVKLADGQTVTIATSSSTTYHGQSTASQSDVTAGKTVTVQTAPITAGTGGSTGGTATAGSTTRTATDVTVTGN